MTAEIDKLTKILKESNNIVFFGGAGMSTDSSNKVHKSEFLILEVPMDYLMKNLMLLLLLNN